MEVSTKPGAIHPARTNRHPSTSAAIEIAAKKVVKLVPAKVLNDAINKGSPQNSGKIVLQGLPH
ncbi:HU family DNA-binding protein [Pseudomonas savastanoi pv. savastanoi]|nr:hypothetical protein AL051_05045 [Pseudomonas amygdali pv. dendropanacis]UKL10093.1 HU family DNA-binding protein [Pseudomonas savastanoi pv. savastanoi]